MCGQWSLFNEALVSSFRSILFSKKGNWLLGSWSRSSRLQYRVGKQINKLEYINRFQHRDLHGGCGAGLTWDWSVNWKQGDEMNTL